MVSSRPLPLPPLHNQQSVARGSGKEKEATETDAAALNSRAGAGRWLRGVPCLTICDIFADERQAGPWDEAVSELVPLLLDLTQLHILTRLQHLARYDYVCCPTHCSSPPAAN